MEMVLTLLADLLLMAAAFGAASYCYVLSRRLTRLSSFDKGLGGAIAVLSAQVDEMKAALEAAQTGSEGAVRQLQKMTEDARTLASDLEMMIAACHDLSSKPAATDEGPEIPEPAPVSMEDGGGADEGESDASDDADPNTGAEAGVPVFGRRRGAAETEPPADSAEMAVFHHRRASPAEAAG